MTFTTQTLTGQRVLVIGTDINGVTGQVVVDGSEWADINAHKQHAEAHADFDAGVEEFFAPLLELAEKLEQTLEVPTDETEYIVISEGVEATEGRQRQVVRLTKDSQVLRLIDQCEDDRLIWVNGELEILAASPAPVPTGAVDEAHAEG